MPRGLLVPSLVVLLDVAAMVVALLVSLSLVGSGVGSPRDLVLGSSALPPLPVVVVVWLLLLRAQGFYDPLRMYTLVRSLRAISRATIGTGLAVLGIDFLLGRPGLPREQFLAGLGLGFLLLAASRAVLLRLRISRPGAVVNVAIFGVGPEAALTAARLQAHALDHRVVGFLEPVAHSAAYAVPLERILGRVGELRELVNQHRLHTLVLASRSLARQEALALTLDGAQMGLRVLQVPVTWGIATPRLELAELGDLQLVDLGQLRYPRSGEALKRLFDVVGVVLGGLMLLPLLALIAAVVRLDSPGPALYRAPRVGRGGRSFHLLKFRSMHLGADTAKEGLRGRNESDGLLFKIQDDPRVTRVGRWLRRWSLDELPQLWNVLRGEMNLVGPRPLPVEDLAEVQDDPEILYWFELRHQVHPGITGLWQVRGRSTLGFQEMVRLDVNYVQSWSFWLDLKVLLQTLPAVLRGRGAS